MSDTPTPKPPNSGETHIRAGEPLTVLPAAARYCRRCRVKLEPYRPDDIVWPSCHRCGLPYNPSDPRTYVTDPRLPRWQWALVGFILAVVIGVATYGLIVLQAEQGLAVLGVGSFFGVLIAVGA